MMKHKVLISLLFVICVMLVGCGSMAKDAAAGGALGAAAGAGTGAITGAVISNGDIAASAVLGGAVGLPIGIALGIAYTAYDQEYQEKVLMDRYWENQNLLFQREREIEKLREQIRQDGPKDLPDESLRDHNYHGPRLGSPL